MTAHGSTIQIHIILNWSYKFILLQSMLGNVFCGALTMLNTPEIGQYPHLLSAKVTGKILKK